MKYIFQFSSLFSLLSLVLGIASLTTALLFINGFSLGLEKAIVDMSGHVIVVIKEEKHKREILESLSPYDKFIETKSLFLSSEALVLDSKKFQPLMIEAIEDKHIQNSDFLDNRILKGKMQASKDFILIGKALSEQMNLQVGSSLPIIVFDKEQSYFSRKKQTFKVGAIADFGRYDFNSRYVITSLSNLQNLKEKTNQVVGARLWLKDKNQAEFVTALMNDSLENNYEAYSWKDLDRNFFEVIEADKKIIFFVLFILILAAGFNVSSSLFVQVFQKTKVIGILKSMGAKESLIRNIFILQSLVIGFIGVLLGMVLGWFLSLLLIELQNKMGFIPQEVYQVNQIVLEWKNSDMAFIFFSSLIVVIISSLIPARRACKLHITEALAYE